MGYTFVGIWPNKCSAETTAQDETISKRVEKLEQVTSIDGPGTIYTRWGRTSCPGNGTELVYSGYAAGTHYTHSGGASNFLCLPKEPSWGHFTETSESTGAFVYGVEYELDARNLPDFFGKEIRNHDVPCAVCHSKRSSVLMTAGRINCFDGWTHEYTGYLTAEHHGHASASEFACLDKNPEDILNGSSNVNGRLMYFAEVVCGPLPCPPYAGGRELSCVVCTK